MKKILLFAFFSILATNVQASEGCDNKTLAARIFHNIFLDTKLVAAISSLNEMLAELKDKHIQHTYSRVVSDYWSGNTRHIVTQYYYTGDGDVIDVVNRYEEALNNLRYSNALLAAGDGALLGALLAITGKMFEWNIKTAGVSLVLSSTLLMLAKSRQIEKVPYLTFPTLTVDDNYFGILTNMGTFICILGAGAASYFGTGFLIDAASGKVSAINEAVNIDDFSVCS
jgi:hypothetical protein